MPIQDAAMMRAGVAVSTLVLGLSLPSVVLAQDATDDRVATPATSTTPAADKPAEPAKPHDDADDRWRATLDAVFGFGATPVLSQKIIGPLVTQESRTAETVRYATTSLNLGLSNEIMNDFRVGVLLPVGFGSVFSSATRGSTVVGNVTLGGVLQRRTSNDVTLSGGLDVALPTASGEQLPDAATIPTLGHVDQKQLDRFSLLHAMSDSRGREDTAAFTSNHLGLVPKLGAAWTASEKVDLDGYVKYQSLHATSDNAVYEGSVVVAVRGSYHLSKTVDGTLRVWTNLAVAGPDSPVAAVEPQLSARLGWVTPMVGVVLPVAGELTSPYNVGVRAVLAARF